MTTAQRLVHSMTPTCWPGLDGHAAVLREREVSVDVCPGRVRTDGLTRPRRARYTHGLIVRAGEIWPFYHGPGLDTDSAGKCQRKDPPCKYLHPPQHLKEQLLQNGRNNLILKNLHNLQMQAALAAGMVPGAVMPGTVPVVSFLMVFPLVTFYVEVVAQSANLGNQRDGGPAMAWWIRVHPPLR
ncbi:hypothetical protein LSH36_381g02000 [Paralvinella palmiformis]|uniref:Muscleblind-like CCCH zinc finger domain-containing protein n=1 Tax=Paralvinella palmiformis TaxID=53620 RepID=A0AAD9JDI3_9ANNE|nr:hypothetical protein LSH36_381g02000 [Paralvinella palmiformis]